MKKHTKEEVQSLIQEAKSNIIKYENNIKLERERIKRIQEVCRHEWGEWEYTPYDQFNSCKICGKKIIR